MKKTCSDCIHCAADMRIRLTVYTAWCNVMHCSVNANKSRPSCMHWKHVASNPAQRAQVERRY